MNETLHAASATRLLAHYRRRELSPVEVTRAVLARIEAVNPAVNAFVLVAAETALASARDSEARWARGAPCGLLDGVPVTIKDLLLTRGMPTLRGSRVVDPAGPWDLDAPASARLREQGAVIVGKTTTPEFGWKGVTDSQLAGVTRNPWNTALTPGGSSGGAAAAAALGMGALHIGTDGGGSIRIPAGFSGVFGHKPSFGRVPAWPLSPFGTVAHIGPMTRTVEDAALMLDVLSIPDHRDWFSLPHHGRDYRVGLDDGVRGLRIAYSPDLGHVAVHAEVAARVREAVDVLADLGAQVEQVEAPFEDPADTFRKHWYAGAANLFAGFGTEQRAQIDAGLQEVAEEGASYSLLDYLAATNERGALGQRMTAFHQHYDLLVTPALPIPAFTAGREVPDPARQTRWTEWTPFSYPFNLTQQPACSAPCGFTGDGLPVGLQIVGPMHADALVLRAARAYESARPFVMAEAPVVEA